MPTAFTSIFITTRDARVIIGGAMHGDSYRAKADVRICKQYVIGRVLERLPTALKTKWATQYNCTASSA